MRAKDLNEAVYRHLFSDEDSNVFAALDGASVPELLDKLYGLLPEFECIFSGELEPDMAEVAPYLIQLYPNSEFTKWVVTHGWGQHWGIFAVGTADFRAIRNHFRSLSTVYDAAGTPMLFRYYDPRVMRTYLPTCNADELATVFGPSAYYIMEDTDPWSLLRFGVDSGSLFKKAFPLESVAPPDEPGVSRSRAQI
jgi:hypothetical protein